MFAPLFPDRLWKARIRWTRPREYYLVRRKRTRADRDAHFYTILSRKKSRLEVHYIGKTYKNEVWSRLSQPDHCRRLKVLQRKFQNRKLLVSHGILRIE